MRWCVTAGLSADESLVDALASLAAETSADMSLDDHDSVISQVMLPLSADEKREIVDESLEMSQRVWPEALRPDDDDAAAADDDDDMYVIHRSCS